MPTCLNFGRAGLAVAVVTGGLHLCWALLVAAGWAQPVVDFLFWVHFIKPTFVIEPFDAGRAAILVATTAGIGFLAGAIFALAWNALNRSSRGDPAQRAKAVR